MMLLVVAMVAASLSAESCALVRREQGAFNAEIFARLEQIDRAARRPDGSKRPLTDTERKKFAVIEREVEAFIALFTRRLNNCREI